MKIQLKGRAIPRNEGGDPAFETLADVDNVFTTVLTIWQKEDYKRASAAPKPPLLEVFTPEEVVELVNRALYQLEYQHHAHKVRGQAQRDREKRVKDKVKQLFHVSWMKATPEQIQRATEEVEKEQG